MRPVLRWHAKLTSTIRRAQAWPATQLEAAAMAGVLDAHPELSGLVWHETRSSGANRLRRLAVESTWLARVSADADVVHHFGGRLPARRRGAAVVTIHDIQCLDMPHNFSPAKRRYLSAALRRSVRSATLVVTPSQWTADRIVDRFGVDSSRVIPVPSTYATDPATIRPAPTAAAGPQGAVTAHDRSPGSCDAPSQGEANAQGDVVAHGDVAGQGDAPAHGAGPLPPSASAPFVLYPAASFPHKNHELLISAMPAIRRRHRDATLVLTGGPGRAHRQVAEMVAATDGVVHLGHVSPSHLAALYAKAAVVAVPSRYEGFGLPALEAMAAGVPLVAANATALPEVVQDGGVLVPPDDLDGWVNAITEALDGSSSTRLRVQRGLNRAEHYAPARSAARLVNAWRTAAALQAQGAGR